MAGIPLTNDGENDENAAKHMADLMGPGHVDQFIRQAIHFCWMTLPKERRTLDEVDSQIRRILERALRDFREDSEAFRRGE